MTSKLVLKITNGHVKSCGNPPAIQSRPGLYISYFENRHGEQAIYTYDKATKVALVYCADAHWEHPYEVVLGKALGLVLDEQEQLWVRVCWEVSAAPDGELDESLRTSWLNKKADHDWASRAIKAYMGKRSEFVPGQVDAEYKRLVEYRRQWREENPRG